MDNGAQYLQVGEIKGERPVARVILANPDPEAGAEPLEIDAVLDTGSDISCLLDVQVAALGLLPTSFLPNVITAGGTAKLPKYIVEIEFSPSSKKTIFMLGIQGPYPLIGRDLLDSWSICFDGPRQAWTIPCCENAAPN